MKLPIISGLTCIKILTKHFDFIPLRRKGSHMTISNGTIFVTVPMHKTMLRGTLQGILKQAGISRGDFLKYI